MASQPYIVGIIGGSGSGKTSFVNRLKQELDTQVSYLSLDNYYLPREQQVEDTNGVRNFDRPESILFEELYNDIISLQNGQSVKRNKYTFNNAQAKTELVKVNPSKIIIIEGLFLLHYKKVKRLLDLKVYIHARDELKLIRRIRRDKDERNYPIEDVTYRYEHHVMPSYRSYIEPYRGEADIVINNNVSYEKGLTILIHHLESQIKAQQ